VSEKDLEKLLRRLRPLIERNLDVGDAPCPPAETLRDFLAERLPEDRAGEIAHHLVSCDRCGRIVVAWETVEAEDQAATAAERSAGRRRLPAPRWMLAGSVAAAALLAYLLIPVFLAAPTFTAEYAVVGGEVRGGMMTRDQAVELRLLLPEPGYVYIFALDSVEVDLLYPENGKAELVHGPATIPGGGEAWKLANVGAGKNAFLVGVKKRPLEAEERARVLDALRSTANHLAEDEVRAAARPFFEAVEILPFTVQP
jgi:hypothetical protein